MRWIENWRTAGCAFAVMADDCKVYVGSEAAGKRVLAGIGDWIEKHLRWRVNRAKSGVGRPWERKFLGFRINRQGQREAAPQSVERCKQKVREYVRWCGRVPRRNPRHPTRSSASRGSRL